MNFHTSELWAAWALALLVGCLHYLEVSGYNAVQNGLTVSEQKEVFLKTENAFYFSYYEDFVTAPSMKEAFGQMLRDARSEAPDVINAIHRFNIYQEVICGFLFRCIPRWIHEEMSDRRSSLMIDPWYFFRGCSYVLQGLGHIALVRLAAAIGGDGLRGGVLPGLTLAFLAFLHRLDYSRIHDVGMLELRENWAMPVIFAQVWAMTKLLMTHPAFCGTTSWEFLGWRWAFRMFTVLCILLWQFSAFAFLLQVSAAFLCTLLACHNGARSAMMELLNSHLVALTLAAVLLFGNELLVQHLLVTQCVAIKLVLSLRKAPTWRCLWWLDGALAVMLFLVLRVLQMPFATADEHVWELYANKMRTLFPSYLGTAVQKEPTFNTSLYNAVSVFDFISWKNIEVGFQTKIYHMAAMALVFQAGAFLLQILPHAGKETVSRESYGHVFASLVLLLQTGLFLILGCFISRLKCIGVPFLLLFVSVALAPKPLEVLLVHCSHPGDKRPFRPTPWWFLRMFVFLAAVAGQLGYVTFLGFKMPFIENRHTSLHSDKGWPDGDRGEFFSWVLSNIPDDEIVLAAMPLSAELRRAASTAKKSMRFAIHPQFEAHHLRERVQELYQFYQCTPPAQFAKTMEKFQSRYLILEFKRCSFGPFLLDKYPEVNCKEKEVPWQNLFCPRALASPIFELQWANAEFAVLRLKDPKEVPKNVKDGRVDDLKTWEPMLQRCQKEEPLACAARAADLALAFRKMGQMQVSQILMRWAEAHGDGDAAFQYIMGHHLDYDLQQSSRAGPYYKKAVDLEPNNPVFVKEYLMWLELIAKDKRSLVQLLSPRRKRTDNELYRRALTSPRRLRTDIKLALTDLEDPSLACEASVTAKELFQDLDWSRDLWDYALENGRCNQCVDNNWPIHSSAKSMRDEIGDWQLFLNIFWRRSMRSSLLSITGHGGRHGHYARRHHLWKDSYRRGTLKVPPD